MLPPASRGPRGGNGHLHQTEGCEEWTQPEGHLSSGCRPLLTLFSSLCLPLKTPVSLEWGLADGTGRRGGWDTVAWES